MSFKAYEEYKDSGVEWLGEVPAHWQVVKLSYISSSKGGGTPPKDNLEYWNGGISWVTPKDMKRRIITKTMDTITPKAIDASSVQMIPPGHTLIVFRSGILRHTIPVAINRNAVTINQDMRAYNLAPYVSSNFFLRLVQGLNRELIFEWSKQGATVESLDSELVDSTKIPMPSKKEQTTITAFLDHETARIDALIEEQQRLIALLKEKRQAVISHAVTKGLDPNVPMKDSGVEWLGEVPAHWGFVPIGLLTKNIQTGPFGSQLHSHEYIDGGTPVVNPSNIRDGFIYPDSSNTVDNETASRLSQHILSEGDIVIGRRGEMGKCAVVTSHQIGWICGTGSMRITTNDKLESTFASTYIRTPFIKETLKIESVGSTMDNLNPEILSRIKITLPPVHEQRQIVEEIQDNEVRFSKLITLANQTNQLLQERRSALISAAVTGKIDVRDWQPPKANQTVAKPAEASV